MSAREILRKDGRAEAVGGIIGATDGFIFGMKRGDGDEWSEDFFAGNGHLGCDIGEDGGGDEESFAADVLMWVPTGDQGCSLTLSGLNVV